MDRPPRQLAGMPLDSVHVPRERVRGANHLAGTSLEAILGTEPLEPQITAVINAVGLSSQEWQTYPLLINPPGYAPAAFVLLAQLHGRIGHFPSLIRLRPKYGATTTFEVAEILNLQTIREAARRQR